MFGPTSNKPDEPHWLSAILLVIYHTIQAHGHHYTRTPSFSRHTHHHHHIPNEDGQHTGVIWWYRSKSPRQSLTIRPTTSHDDRMHPQPPHATSSYPLKSIHGDITSIIVSHSVKTMVQVAFFLHQHILYLVPAMARQSPFTYTLRQNYVSIHSPCTTRKYKVHINRYYSSMFECLFFQKF